MKAEFQPAHLGIGPDPARHPGRRQHHPRQGAPGPPRARLPARARPSADRGHARRGQDHARARARARRSACSSSASSSPATCCRPTSSASRSTSARAACFKFHPGPIFAQVMLADEVNRATPKTQSALLEAMEEHQVTAEGETRKLPEPFFVIATQNPSDQVGTFPLPESQLDRFLMRIELGYPDARRRARAARRAPTGATCSPTLEPCMTIGGARWSCRAPCSACTSRPRCSTTCRRSSSTRAARPTTSAGLSPRAALALLHAARAWALHRGPRQGAARGRAGGAAGRRRAPAAPGARLVAPRRRRRATSRRRSDPIAEKPSDTLHPAAPRPAARVSIPAWASAVFFASAALIAPGLLDLPRRGRLAARAARGRA